MLNKIISDLAKRIKDRLLQGSPFSSASAAWQGSELLATIDDTLISLSYTSCDKAVRIRATNRTEFLGSLEIARRVARGKYESLVDGPAIEGWLGEVLPGQVEAPTNGESKSLLDLAIAEFGQRSQWATGESVTIWQNNGHQAWLKNESGFITLTLFKEAKKLTERKYSKKLTVGYFHPGDYAWLESEHLREDYPRWSVEARAAVA